MKFDIKTGIDIVENERIKLAIERHGERFIKKIYTAAEIEYCEKKKNKIENYSGFFAAKESVLKALGTGISQGLKLRDIEILHYKSGEPFAVLHALAKAKLQELGFSNVRISISHERKFSVAVAILF